MLLVAPHENDRNVNVCVQVTTIETRSQNHAVPATRELDVWEQMPLPCGVGDVFPSGPSGRAQLPCILSWATEVTQGSVSHFCARPNSQLVP